MNSLQGCWRSVYCANEPARPDLKLHFTDPLNATARDRIGGQIDFFQFNILYNHGSEGRRAFSADAM
jgi:hypothetical protein